MKKRIIITLFILVGLSAIPLMLGIFYLYTEAEKVKDTEHQRYGRQPDQYEQGDDDAFFHSPR